jgi:hypothetical protein
MSGSKAWIYIAHFDFGDATYVKVGVTSGKPVDRVCSLQTPEQYKRIWAAEMPSIEAAKEIETVILENFNEYRRNGEWLLLPGKAIDKIWNFIMMIEKVWALSGASKIRFLQDNSE